MLDGFACVENFRDVGEWVNALAGEPILLLGKLLRGGSTRTLPTLKLVGHPRTILNLQSNPDPTWDGVIGIHLPAPPQADDVYETDHPEIRRWLRTIVRALAESGRPPVYIHCHSGRDRTGVVVVAILRALRGSEEIAALEYAVSDGVPRIETIRKSLAAIGDPARYFQGLALARLRALFLASYDTSPSNVSAWGPPEAGREGTTEPAQVAWRVVMYSVTQRSEEKRGCMPGLLSGTRVL